MYETHYHRPKDLAEAAKMFSAASEPKYIAGGQTLLPTEALFYRLGGERLLIDVVRQRGRVQEALRMEQEFERRINDDVLRRTLSSITRFTTSDSMARTSDLRPRRRI